MDTGFGLATSRGEERVKKGRNLQASGILLKADELRFHSRGKIKIITGGAEGVSQGTQGELVSTGRESGDKTIEIIADNTIEPFEIDLVGSPTTATRKINRLQPVVMGENLNSCLNDMISAQSTLNDAISDFISVQKDINKALAQHNHVSPAGVQGGPTTSPTNNIQIKGYNMRLSFATAKLTTHSNQINLCTLNWLSSASQVSILSKNIKIT